jgi:predicted type IV restriction endonuclease
MQDLNLPDAELKIKSDENGYQVFDIIRRKFLVLTPEEWVRQRFVHYMIDHLGFAKERIGIEVGIEVNKLRKRCDIVYFNRKAEAVMIVECKAGSVALDQKVFDQIARYNLKLDVPVLVVTNGLEHHACLLDKERATYIFLKEIPRANSVEGFQQG